MEKKDGKSAEINSVEELKKHLQFNHELLLKADTSYELYQSFLTLYQNDKEREFSHLMVAIIDALVANCVIIIAKLTKENEKIHIHKSVESAITLFPGDKRLLAVQSSLKNENIRIAKIRAWRDKFYAHSDLENLDDDIASKYPLLREDLNSIIDVCFKAINTVYLVVNGHAVGGYDEGSNKRFIHNTKLALFEIENLRKMFSTYAKMFEYMKENAPYDLLAITDSKLNDEK